MDSASREVADESMPQRMKVGDAVIGDVGNPRRFQIIAEHLVRSLCPRSRKEKLLLRVCRTIECQDGSLFVGNVLAI